MNIPFKKYWDLLADHIKPQKGRFILLAVLLFGSIALQVVNPQIVRYFIDTAQTSASMDTLVAAATIYISIAIINQVVSVGAAYMGENVAWTATNALRAELARHCLSLDMSFHNNSSPGELIERIDGDVAELSNFFSQFAIRVLGNLILIAGIVFAIFLEDWRLGLIYTLFVVLTLIALNGVRGIAIPFQKAEREAAADLFGFLEERLAGTEDIRASGAVDYVLLGLYKLMHAVMEYWMKANLMILWAIFTTLIFLAVGLSIAFLAGSYLYSQGIITLGTAYLLVQYLIQIRRPIRMLTQQIENLQKIGASVERLSDLRAIKTKLVDGPGVLIPSGALPLAFEDVSFSYNETEQVLQDLSFTLAPGKVLGLLGRTGSGKTTLARLCFRLYDLNGGKIRLGEADIAASKLKALRQRVAIVTQDVQLFQASVRDNLTFFNASISDDEILRNIDELGLSDWLHALPDGLDTRLESSGRGLSAGEGQLLAFTRVFLRNPGLVILDEASSRLDPATEQLIERAIDKLLLNRTAIIIAHRLRTVERADEILILENGRLAEHGPRAALAQDSSSRFYGLLQTGLEEVLA